MGNNGNTRFKPGHAPLKPKGAISKTVQFKWFLFNSFKENKIQAKKMLDEMYNNKQDFKWLCGLLADMSPKEVEHSGELPPAETKITIIYPKTQKEETPINGNRIRINE